MGDVTDELRNYKIIKEGEAEILMHSNNTVFFNKAQVKNHPIKEQPPDKSGTVILSKEPKLQANFARAVASLSKAQVKKEVRYLPNPEKHWGPKVRAWRQITTKHCSLLGPEAASGSCGRDTNEASEAVADEMAEHSSHEGHATKRQKNGHLSASQS